MRFLCDVHISLRVSKRLAEAGCDCMHVNQLPNRWHTSDADIARTADAEDRILISKNADFRGRCILQRSPRKLIKVNLGNIPTSVLITHLLDNLEHIAKLNALGRFLVEVDLDQVTVIHLEH
jgi:predicted nuclease of predicted toxin-antitoxin system